MLDAPKTIEEARVFRYGEWAGNPKGNSYNPVRCAYEVHDSTGWLYHQCFHSNGKGINGLYCGIHAMKVK